MAEGDVLYAPGMWSRTEPAEREILASTVGLKQKGVTLAPGQGFLPAGTPIAPGTGDDAKLFVKATVSGDPGSETTNATGVLRLSVNTGDADTAPRKLGNIVLGGVLKVDALPGADDAARLATAQQLADALNGRVDEHRRELHY